jgi:cobalt-zinc-cadmium efflux system outer membrane protein
MAYTPFLEYIFLEGVTMRRVIIISSILVVACCAVRSPYDRGYVSRTIEERTGHPLDPAPNPGELRLPPAVSVEDGLTEEEAVAVALWNNAAFRVDLAELAFARADLLEASLLPNPLVSYLRLFGVKGQEGYLLWPLDALWQRPKKVAAAEFSVERVAANLVQIGTALSRDTLIAYADLVQARGGATIAEDEAQLGSKIAEIAAARLRAGDISGREEEAIRVETLRTRDAAERAAKDSEKAYVRFAGVLGLSEPLPDLALTPSPQIMAAPPPLSELLASAFAFRPDLKAADLAIQAAGARLGWEKARVIKLTATLESKEKGEAGAFVGPSGKLEIPLFNRNEGGKARARAEMERAAQDYIAVRQRIGREVREALAELESARRSLALLREQIVPAAASLEIKAQKAYAAGEESYLFALEARRLFLDAQRREIEADADARRAEARLRCALGSYRTVAAETVAAK